MTTPSHTIHTSSYTTQASIESEVQSVDRERVRLAAMEDFTFPTFPLEQCNSKKAPFPHFASASPWLVVPGAVLDTTVHEHDHRRSFSAVEQHEAAGTDHHHQLGGFGYDQRHGSARFAVEEKMDMLWEDFNEELARAAQPCPCPLTKGTPSWGTAKESWWLAGGDGDEGAFIETRKHGAVVRRRRMGLLMMLRLLKKLFLAHKSGAAPSRKAPPI